MEEIKIRSLRDNQKEKFKKTENFLERKTEPVSEPADGPARRRNLPLLAVKFIVFTLFVFAIGGAGGIFLDRILLPDLLVKYPALSRISYLRRVSEQTTIVEKTQEVRISQEEAISDAIDKVSPSVVAVLVKNAAGQFEQVGTGIILTSDGYIITPLRSVLTGTASTPAPAKEIQVKLKTGKTYDAQLATQSADYSLAMLKISESNLSVIPYAATEDLKLGQKLIIMGDAVDSDIISKFIDNYKTSTAGATGLQKRIQLTQNLDASFTGSAVINLEGKLVGVGQGGNLVIPLGEIMNYINTSTTHA
jgi:S1-C subfamily serine protease